MIPPVVSDLSGADARCTTQLGDLPERLALHFAGIGKPTFGELLDALSRGLSELGVPLWRTFVGIETLHPVHSGRTVTWAEGRIDTRQRDREGVTRQPDYLNSPVRLVDESRAPLRIRLNETDSDMPTLAALKRGGGTDYVIHPLPFIDRNRTAVISFATQAPDGFGQRDLDRITAAVAVIGPQFERLAVREIAVNLLDTYVGPRSGRRVFEGLINRGDLLTVSAAILFADLRDYTALSERMPGPATVRLLDAWFDVLGEPIEKQGGEILKFLGDGVLAVFPGADAQEACRAALEAAADTDRNFYRVADAANLPRDEIEYGIGLHYGDVGYGNVGTRTRLDFTVIGPAVNLTSRLQDLSKRLPHTVLASAAFAAHVPDVMIPHASHDLRGIAEPVEVFTLNSAR
ncbi:adenylate/guanylate cyclase domain-containing protein [Microbaculum sp. FT89]|uniref:adenylate/guanylate cyclase domain-containing protein n=1 Tax=Microbaculum sp. FT89 TaxID=3447298 RepID=UPI003F53CA94